MTVFRYIFVKLVGRFCFIFCCLFLVILLGFSMQQMHKMGGGGVVILRELLPYLASYVSVYTVPVSLLLAVATVYMRMAREREIIALQAGGYAKQYLARPALILAFLLSCILFYVTNYQLPASEYAKENLDVTQLESLLASSSRKQNSLQLENTVFRYETIKNGFLHNVQVIEFTDEGAPSVWFSGAKGRFLSIPSLQDPVLRFELDNVTVSTWTSGENGNRENDLRQAQVMRFQKDEPFIYRRHMKDLLGLKAKELDETTLTELIQLARGKPPGRLLKKHSDHKISLAINKRASLALAPIVFVLFCVPVAMLVGDRSVTGGMGMVVVPVLVLFYPWHIFSTRYAEASSAIPPALLYWPPVILLLIAGYVLINRGN